MIRLNDLQLVLLTSAAQRADGSLLPPPDSVGNQAARIRKVVPALIKHGLVSEGPASAVSAWLQEGDDHVGVFITVTGREAIGATLPTPDVENFTAPPPVADSTDKKPTKAALVLGLLQREEGATLPEIVAATGWLPHTTRAALTGLRKKGHAIARGKRGDTTCYSLPQAA